MVWLMEDSIIPMKRLIYSHRQKTFASYKNNNVISTLDRNGICFFIKCL